MAAGRMGLAARRPHLSPARTRTWPRLRTPSWDSPPLTQTHRGSEIAVRGQWARWPALGRMAFGPVRRGKLGSPLGDCVAPNVAGTVGAHRRRVAFWPGPGIGQGTERRRGPRQRPSAAARRPRQAQEEPVTRHASRAADVEALTPQPSPPPPRRAPCQPGVRPCGPWARGRTPAWPAARPDPVVAVASGATRPQCRPGASRSSRQLVRCR